MSATVRKMAVSAIVSELKNVMRGIGQVFHCIIFLIQTEVIKELQRQSIVFPVLKTMKVKLSNSILIFRTVRYQYHCSNSGCHRDSSTKGEDWGYYSGTNGDCNYCQMKCNSDRKCGGIECGTSYCTWWKVGVCSLLDSDKKGYTCRKDSIGI